MSGQVRSDNLWHTQHSIWLTAMSASMFPKRRCLPVCIWVPVLKATKPHHALSKKKNLFVGLNSLSFFYYYYFWRAVIKDQRSGWSYNCSSGCRFVLHISSLDAHPQHCLKTRVSIILVALCSACVCYSIDAHPLYPTPPPWALVHDLPSSIFTLTAVLTLQGSVTTGQLPAKIRSGFIFPLNTFLIKGS